MDYWRVIKVMIAMLLESIIVNKNFFSDARVKCDFVDTEYRFQFAIL